MQNRDMRNIINKLLFDLVQSVVCCNTAASADTSTGIDKDHLRVISFLYEVCDMNSIDILCPRSERSTGGI